MAIEGVPRRALLRHALGWSMLSGGPMWPASVVGATVATTTAQGLIAAWDDPQGRHWVGRLALRPETNRWQADNSLELPTRAHGLMAQADGSVVVCARRPGEWLLRWWPDHPRAPQWYWMNADRRFTGHVVAPSGDTRVIFSVEADQADGQGWLVRRDAVRLTEQARWPTHGIDPHQALWDTDGSVLVANGGVPTLPETGRTRRDMQRMDSSLVRLDGRDGTLRAQWRLADPRLSLRHMARHASGVVGISLQAEHDEAETRRTAPLLAVLSAQGLHLASQPQALAGYGGDIIATPGGFAVGAPRAGGIACWSLAGEWAGWHALEEGCSLTAAADTWWAGGRRHVLHTRSDGTTHTTALPAEVRLDNHWISTFPGK